MSTPSTEAFARWIEVGRAAVPGSLDHLMTPPLRGRGELLVAGGAR